MKSLFYGTIAVMVMGLAFWAYQQNYRTRAELKETEALQAQIAHLRERLSVLRAEWAYLNRPDRLRDLADLNFERLRLLPMSPEQFGRVEQVAYPPSPSDLIARAVDVRGAPTEAVE